MEHAEFLVKSIKDVKDILFGFNNISTWIKLVLLMIVPLFIGLFGTILLFQNIVKSALLPIFVNSGKYGFTEDGLSHMLFFFSFLCGVVLLFLIPFFQGYLYRVIRSDSKPSDKNLLSLFFSGWRVNIVCLFYAIPGIFIYLVYGILYYVITDRITGFISLAATSVNIVDTVMFIIFLVIQFITFICVSLFGIISLVHVARGGSFKEAFKLRKIKEIIRQIGWYNYLLGILICAILILLISLIIFGIGLTPDSVIINCLTIVIYSIFLVPIGILCAKFLTRIYDAGTAVKKEDTEDFDDF